MADPNLARLHHLLAGIRRSTAPATDGRGFKAWETRRANEFTRAVHLLVEGTAPLFSLHDAAYDAGEAIADSLPDGDHVLPRGYTVTRNAQGFRTFALGTVAFNPHPTEPAPHRVAVEAFCRDLKTGLIGEIAASFAQKGGNK